MNTQDCKILIADDNFVNQQVLLKMIDIPKSNISIADDGSIAVDHYLSQDVDFIFMDVSMPNMDGITAAKKIRAFEKSQNKNPVPIIAVTANVSDETERECLAAGMNHYMTKPVSRQKINAALKTYLQLAA